MTRALLSDLTRDNVVDRLGDLFEAIMESSYLGEKVTIGEHMPQCARRDAAPRCRLLRRSRSRQSQRNRRRQAA